MTGFQLFSLITILIISVIGGYFPLFKYKGESTHAFSGGKAFTSGVFLALSLTVMLPSGFSLWTQILQPHVYPMATYITIATFIILLAIEHKLDHVQQDADKYSPVIPIVMTLMIGLCSFLLGTALGVSDTLAAIMVFFAIIAHKGSAAFALSLTMVRSKMTRPQSFICFGIFALATPAGIVVGSIVHHSLSSHSGMIFKALVVSIAAGVFLYLATTFGLRHTPFVSNCKNKKGFFYMLIGLLITVAVSVILNYAQHLSH